MLHLLPTRKLSQPCWLWLLLAACWVGLGAANHAEASCGDYVRIGNRQVALMLEMSGEHGATPGQATSTRWGVSDKPSAPAPCHGPQCRQRKAPKGLPVPTVVSLERSEAVLCGIDVLKCVLVRSRRTLSQNESSEWIVGRGLYRPPRMA
jgi:hypothetical protein